ncbi:ATP-grasp domain-containing protein [Methanolobus sp.]|jgi:carbamoyl-phosphate synthase large subunit|uniref:ATP-grasp domain-containing protein n=1 Tax=Methanolobus sp. TaxID=1874737 RepID=UPI0025F6A234|nr:ATP-grasp domain-containing protein [Methanolobus sp.]
MKKIMILGAGRGQVPIINLAKKAGFETIVASIPGDYPGLKIANKIYEVDITDKERVLEAARKEHVDGVIVDQIDIAVPTAAYVTEKLGLPSIGYDCSLKFTNKYLMRNECRKLNIKVPDYYKASTLHEAKGKCLEIGLPVVIKPTDNASSKGVSLIKSNDEIENKFDEAIRNSMEKKVIIEKYIQGREYTVEGFASNYKFTNLVIGKRRYFDISDMFIPSQTIFTSENSGPIEEHILRINQKLIEGFGLKFGVTHSEYLVEEGTEEVYLVEVAARGGGVYISSDLIELATGIDVNTMLLDVASGNLDEIEIQDIKNNVSCYLCFTLPEGIIKEIKGIERVKRLPGVCKIFLDSVWVGMKTEAMKDKSMRMGPILIKGKNKEQCEKTINEVKHLLEINVETSEGEKGIIW